MTIEVSIDRDQCMGSGNCTFNAPGVFALDDQSVAVVVDPSAQHEEVIVRAAKACPTQAIQVTRDGERVVGTDR